ncbi:MAG: RIP metalloprotease RseP, partial [Pseudomonadota bacterium]
WAQILETLDELSGQIAPIEVERDGQRLRFDINQARVDRFSNGSPAEAAGLETGDLIVDIAGTPIESFRDLQLAMAALPLETEISVAVLRDGTRQEVQFVPDVVTRQHPETGVRVGQATMGISSIGFVGIAPELEAVGPAAALSHGVATTWGIVTTTMTFLSDMLFKGADTSALGGPIGIAQVSAEQAKEGVTNFIQLIAFLSTSIGLLNLFPIPVLDGGHLVFYAAETVRGKPLGERWTNAAMAFGLSLVLLLMVFATYNDLTRL